MAFQIGRKRKLLAELHKLTHSDRVRHMSEFGRDHAGTRELRDLLDSLDGDLYQWQLRLYAASAAGESSDIVNALSSPLRSVRSLAIVSLRTVDVDFADLIAAVGDMATSDRRALLAVVRQRGDAVVADQLISQIHDHYGAEEASVLLAACSSTVALEWMPRLAHAMSNWPTVVRVHPRAFVEFLRAQMSLAPIVRDAWWTRAASGISELADIDPAAALDLWADFGPHGMIPSSIMAKLPRLATEDVNRTLTMLLDPAHRSLLHRVLRSVKRRIRFADDHVVAALAQALVHDHWGLATVLSAVAPSRRADLFRQATANVDISQITWDMAVLQALPHQLRHRETRRMLGLPAYQNADDARHELMIWLPISDTWDELLSATTAHDATRRGAAYARLVRAVLASHDSAYFDRLLNELPRLRNEQDPVRAHALLSLALCPARFIDESYMNSIDELVGFVIESRDTSRQTVATLTTLVQRILAHSATPDSIPILRRCVDALVRLAGQNGRLQFGPLHRTLPKGGEFALCEALEPRIKADLRAGRPELLFNLVRALGPRGHRVARLEAHLEALTRAKSDRHAQLAIQLWLAVPGDRAAKLGELINHEPSTVLVHPVFDLVSLIRQDLLDIAMSSRALTGRFAPTTNRQVPMINRGLLRWTPAQRNTYGALLDAAANNEHIAHMRTNAIRCLARIPEVGTDRIRRLTQSDDVVTSEAALTGLSWGETPARELSTLLSYANSDRARVAVYSATRAARFSPPHVLDSVIAQLLQADDSKLTSRKEALRILSRNRTPGAIEVFTALWAQRPLHRSIAIALASALRNYPNNDLTWDVYSELAAGGVDTALAIAQSMDPATWPQERRSQLATLCSPLVQHDHAAVRDCAWANLAALRPWDDDISASISDAVVDLSTVTSWRPALRQLHLLLDGFPDDPVLAEAVKRLAEQPVPAQVSDASDRDLSVQQRLEAVAAVKPNSVQGKATMRLAAEHLVSAGFAAEATMFVASGVDWAEPETTLRRLTSLGEQHPAALPRLHLTASNMLEATSQSGVWNADDLLALSSQLAASTEAAGLVATAVVGAAGPKSGWAQPWRQLLSELRAHDSIWVQSHALRVRTSAE